MACSIENACGSIVRSILTDENRSGFSHFISLQQFCIQRIPRRKFPPSDAWLRYIRSMPSIPQRYIVVLQSPVPAGRDAMPLGQTSPAAASRGVLGDKDRMPAHRGLPPVIGNNGRSEACAHEICGMTPDSLHAFSLDIGDIFRFQTKSSAELGCRQSGKQRIEGFCRMGIFNHFSPQIKSATKIRTVNAFLSVRTGFSFGIFRKQYQPCQSDGCRQRQNSRRQEQRFQ